MPTGIIVKCQDERSQLKNKAKAMKVLRSRLLDLEQQKQDDGDLAPSAAAWSAPASAPQKIRTYNYPQNRVTDHRIGLTLHKLIASSRSSFLFSPFFLFLCIYTRSVTCSRMATSLNLTTWL